MSKKIPCLIIVAAVALMAAAVVCLYNPWSVTNRRLQNRIFIAQRIVVEPQGDHMLVMVDITARNPAIRALTFDGVSLQSMGEYSRVFGFCQTECDKPFTLKGRETGDVNVFYRFDEDLFISEYAENWAQAQNCSFPDTAACVEDFLRNVNLIFHSDDLPGSGKAYCFTSEQTPEYERLQ